MKTLAEQYAFDFELLSEQLRWQNYWKVFNSLWVNGTRYL